MKIVATTSLPAVDRPNAARSCQYQMNNSWPLLNTRAEQQQHNEETLNQQPENTILARTRAVAHRFQRRTA